MNFEIVKFTIDLRSKVKRQRINFISGLWFLCDPFHLRESQFFKLPLLKEPPFWCPILPTQIYGRIAIFIA